MSFFRSRPVVFILIFLILMSLSIAFLPTLANTNWGRAFVVSRINHQIPGKLQIKKMHLSWTQGQMFEGILLQDPDLQTVLTIDKFSTDTPLWQLLRKPLQLDQTLVEELNGQIIIDEKGSSNLQKALGGRKKVLDSSSFSSIIELSHVNAQLQLFDRHQPIKVSIKGNTKIGPLDGSFEFNVMLPQLNQNWDRMMESDQNDFIFETGKKANIHAQILNFPVGLIDQVMTILYPNLNGMFYSWIGDRLNLTIDQVPEQSVGIFNIDIQSPLMKGQIQGKIDQEKISFAKPGTFDFNLNQKLLHVNIPNFFLPLSFLKDTLQRTPALLTLNLEYLQPGREIETLTGQFEIYPKKNGAWETLFSLQSPKLNLKNGHVQLGQEIVLLSPAHLEAVISKECFKRLSHSESLEPETPLQIEVLLKTLQFKCHKNILEFTQPIKIEYTLPPSHFIFKKGDSEFRPLLETTFLEMEMYPTRIDLNNFSMPIKGNLLLKEFKLANDEGIPTTLKDLQLLWNIDLQNHGLTLDLKGGVQSPTRKTPLPFSAYLHTSFSTDRFDFNQSQTEVQFHFESMPTALFSMIGKTPDLSLVIGPTLDLKLKAYFDTRHEKPGYLDASLDSALLHLYSRFSFNDSVRIFEPHKLPTLRWTVTPESFNYLKKFFPLPKELFISQPVVLSGQLSQLDLPLKNPSQSLFEFQFVTTPIEWKNSSSPFQLEGQLSDDDQKLQFLASIIGNSKLELKAVIDFLFDSEGQLKKWDELNIEGSLEGKKIDPIFLQNNLLMDPISTNKLEALFGQSLDIQGSVHWKKLIGPLQLHVKGEKGEIHIEGECEKRGLTLTQPLECTFTLSSQFIDRLMAPNVPFLKNIIATEEQVHLTIKPDQFFCPLFPFKLDALEIGDGRLNLGKIQFKNEGDFNSIFNFIRTIKDPIVSIWFTPIPFSVEKSLLQLERFDMQIADSYTLASWGKVNLQNHQGELVLALSAEALEHAFGIKGLEKDYLLQIPLHFKNSKILIDQKKASARMTSLLAQTKGGTKGKFLSTLLESALSEPGEKIPPPTTQPFPWQQAQAEKVREDSVGEDKDHNNDDKSDKIDKIDDKNDENSKKKKKHKKRESDSIKEGALKLLDQLLKK